MCNICQKGVFHHRVGAVTQISPCPNGCNRATPEELDARIERQIQRLLTAMRKREANAC